MRGTLDCVRRIQIFAICQRGILGPRNISPFLHAPLVAFGNDLNAPIFRIGIGQRDAHRDERGWLHGPIGRILMKPMR